MNEPRRAGSTPSEDGRLDSWKEIASHLKVSVRTAQRWERTEQLPVRRHRHAALSSVFAYRSQLDAWWNSRPDLRRAPVVPAPAPPSIAVLPFVNLNRDDKNEILSDGLTEELINALTRLEGLHVVARTSAFQFKDKPGDVREVGARLGVQTILEGSVRRTGDRLRVTAQLIDVADGCHLWSERVDRRMQDLFEVQEEIARTIVETLRVKLVGGPVTRPYTKDLETYALYLEGRYHFNTRTRRGLEKAIECFEQALARDAGMALAWTGVADCHSALGPLADVPADETLRRAKTAILKALEIDDRLAEAHASLAFITGAYEYNWSSADRHFRRALELNPDSAIAHIWYAAVTLAPQARHEEAELHLRRACELDPLSPVALGARGMHRLTLRQADAAISAIGRALELDPAYPWACRALGEAYLLKEMHGEAAAAFARIEAPVYAAGFLGYCYARSGREREARQLFHTLEHSGSASLACQLAILCLGLGDRDAALNWLGRALDARCMGMQWLRVEPIWDPLRRDTRFTALLKRMDLIE